jgi:hypothetical protein
MLFKVLLIDFLEFYTGVTMPSACPAYDLSSISINESFEITLRMEISDKMSFRVPFAISSCIGTVIL